MTNPEVTAALDAGAVVVTPNNRLARFLANRHDEAQMRAGRGVWPTPRVLPWNAWLSSLWLDGLAAGAFAEPLALLNPTQAARLWERAIGADDVLLLDADGAADRAASAWWTFHAYANAQETIGQFSNGGDDAAAFARWGRRYARAVADLRCVDRAQLPDVLIAALQRLPFLKGRSILLAGFVEFAPQQARLVDAIRAAGADVDSPAAPSSRVTRSRSEYRTSSDELVAALQWARDRIEEDPGARATIVVDDLLARYDLIVQLADEILRPRAVAAGALEGARPYNLSLAPPLSEHPLAVAAFDLLELTQRRLPLARASALLRSACFSGGAAAAGRRARHEQEWRERNVTDVSLNAFIQGIGDDDALYAGLVSMSRELRNPSPRSPQAWADMLVDALRQCGWPGSDVQSSTLYQAYVALSRAIGEWRSLALVEPRMELRAALASLRAHCARTMFQPESGPARVEILGMLEAAGLEFDGLWLAGMDADAWPPRATPEAFLPASWQRAHGVVQASTDRSLERAARLTAQLTNSARQSIASHVTTTDASARAVSPLCDWPLCPRSPRPTPTMETIAAAPVLDSLVDATLPTLDRGMQIKGGVRIIEMQSDCPFRAAAAWRLRAGAWPRPGIGLTAMERGTLVHVAMASLWSSIDDQATLLAIDDATLRSRIAAAVEVARLGITEARWRSMPAVIAGVESGRLAALMFAFLRKEETERPPFRVMESEVPVDLAIGGLHLKLRIDRVDAIDEGIAVIDYKTGELPSVRQWLMPRPVAPQTGLYALALRQREPAPRVRAVALLSIKSGASSMRGIADEAVLWKGLSTTANASHERLRDFGELEAWWRERFGALADAFRRGDAAVTPRERPSPCKHCELKPFCRIELHGAGGADGDDEPDDVSEDGE